MMVIVDTCIGSMALRRHGDRDNREGKEVETLIRDSRVQMLGPIRQEILSGVRDEKQFASLRAHLEAFPDLTIETDDYVMAATFYNLCRSRGVQGSNTDFLICSVSVRHHLAIYTKDGDFQQFAAHLPIVLHREEASRP